MSRAGRSIAAWRPRGGGLPRATVVQGCANLLPCMARPGRACRGPACGCMPHATCMVAAAAGAAAVRRRSPADCCDG
ncbi:hypothetical protein F511_46117 [Dorcoceras hygrometricum]|uniref:Uncharacterized protein n=1 Tax=Dorcoceras hygrometricum TaxID=472368 RepID=A0A2Z6ZUC0_9LAMI|nr:hypothetical protein F511_46117 [Dorcoceras hygrometricum]